MTTSQTETSKGKIEYTLLGKGRPILIVVGGHTNCKETIFHKGLDPNKFCFIAPSRPGYQTGLFLSIHNFIKKNRYNLTDNTMTYYFSKKVFIEPMFWLAIQGLVVAFLLFAKAPIIYNFILLPVALLILIIKLPDGLRKIYLFITNKPALVIDNQFLVDNINSQKYNWSDIFDITFSEKHKAICINVGDVNIAKYSDNASWFLTKWLMKFDLGVSHGTFFIGKQFLDINNTALDNLVRFYNLTQARQTC